jgi:transposase
MLQLRCCPRQPERRLPLLQEAANAMLTRSARNSTLKAWAMRIAETRGLKRAKVALARKLAVVMHRMWLDGSEFRWSGTAPAATH